MCIRDRHGTVEEFCVFAERHFGRRVCKILTNNGVVLESDGAEGRSCFIFFVSLSEKVPVIDVGDTLLNASGAAAPRLEIPASKNLYVGETQYYNEINGYEPLRSKKDRLKTASTGTSLFPSELLRSGGRNIDADSFGRWSRP
eukprot:TRINITY_DN4775_c0_g1_i6.p1 TRINITY_DN4775_c0_g1~~TRINITY_DN4775_c0_g1_i6.p1  ORF type:complete len:143 (-),score=29.00 TRINITY_DN4775_c0_g1_i6:242-670(-)